MKNNNVAPAKVCLYRYIQTEQWFPNFAACLNHLGIFKVLIPALFLIQLVSDASEFFNTLFGDSNVQQSLGIAGIKKVSLTVVNYLQENKWGLRFLILSFCVEFL